jgi:hypothetical protein
MQSAKLPKVSFNSGLALCGYFSKFGVQFFKQAFVLADKFFSENPHSAKPQTVGQYIK